MKAFSIFVCFSLISTVFVGCVSSQSGKEPKKVNEFVMKPIEEKTLANGLRIIFIRDTTLPRVSYQLFVQAGSVSDPLKKEGLAAMTNSLLDQGSAHRNSMQLADDFAQLGSAFGDSANQDYSMLSTSGLSQYQTELLELFSDVILHPVFSASEIERKQSQIISELVQKQDNPQSYADELLENMTYAETPYGHPVLGYMKSVKAIRRADILKHYQTFFRPNNSWLAISGNFDRALPLKVEELFGAWPRKDIPNLQIGRMQNPMQKKIKLFSKPGLKQAQIRFGEAGIARNNPDFLKLRIANIVLGGAFSSRLNQRIRDDLGLTYSISSQFETHKDTGSFEISTFSRDEKTGEAIRNTFQLVRDFQKNGITQNELDSAKALLIGQFPAAIETVDRLAYNLLVLRMNGIPDSYLTDFLKNVQAISLKDVNLVISKYIKADDLQTLVFADETKVSDQLRTLGQEAGALTIEKVSAENTK